MTGPAFDAIVVGGEIQRRIGVKTSRDEPLARFTTMRVGGPADLFTVAHNRFELRALVRFARSRALPFTLLGRGSDVVISDRGIRGLVIQVRAEALRVEGERLHADAGTQMARAATAAQAAGLSGLEFGLAIPGTVGGAVWANAGAHDSDIAAVLESARRRRSALAYLSPRKLDRAERLVELFDFRRMKRAIQPAGKADTNPARERRAVGLRARHELEPGQPHPPGGQLGRGAGGVEMMRADHHADSLANRSARGQPREQLHVLGAIAHARVGESRHARGGKLATHDSRARFGVRLRDQRQVLGDERFHPGEQPGQAGGRVALDFRARRRAEAGRLEPGQGYRA